jgi:hypothetical protein
MIYLMLKVFPESLESVCTDSIVNGFVFYHRRDRWTIELFNLQPPSFVLRLKTPLCPDRILWEKGTAVPFSFPEWMLLSEKCFIS